MKLPLRDTRRFSSDLYARRIIILAFGYLLFGLLLGVIGGFQYILPNFLRDQLNFQKTRPLHVYLVITWIFTAAQGGITYFLPRIANRKLWWEAGVKWHFIFQIFVSLLIITCFFTGQFGGREYLEFPPWVGAFIFLSWMPFALNFFFTLRPDYQKAPVYFWSWSTGILFFYITLSESYLWIFDYFNNNVVRDVTIQWKALGSMVGSWNMLVYGSAMYCMEKITGDPKLARSPMSFALYFLGLTNLLFNWGHHTYIVPAAPWIKTTAYLISMTELLILGQIIWQVKRTLATARKNYHLVAFRFLSFADAWIFINLILAIAISVPALNYYTHGTHITVAHAMGATIGINTMLLLALVFSVIREHRPYAIQDRNGRTGRWILITNGALLIFFVSLLGAGIVRILGKINQEIFSVMIEKSQSWFRAFSFSGVLVMVGLASLSFIALKLLRQPSSLKETASRTSLKGMEHESAP